MKYKTFFINFKGLPLKSQGQKFKQLSINSSDKSKLLREIYFLLESLFQVIAFFLLSEVGFLVRISYLFSGHYQILSDWFIFLEYFFDL